MFIFKASDGRTVHCSNAGEFDPIQGKRFGANFHLENAGTKTNKGYPFYTHCINSTPESWISYFKRKYDWDVIPVKLIEVDWE